MGKHRLLGLRQCTARYFRKILTCDTRRMHMFINRKLVVQESLGYITSILSSQIRVYPLKGYCSENNFKIYKSFAFKNNFGVATFCFKGKIIQHDGSISIEYFIRPSLPTLLFILIQFIGLTYLLYSFVEKGVYMIYLLSFCGFMLIYFLALFSQKRKCNDRFVSAIVNKTKSGG